ncbi:unnamed protein product [marine sediment metagenome]|uniref:Uncharacterized protein n=1 Tax=marine sediment metagenome TaxID=412755 RepID=X1CPD1_9ZZZZ
MKHYNNKILVVLGLSILLLYLIFTCSKETPTESENYPIQLFIRVTGSELGLLYSGTYGNSSMSIDVEGAVTHSQYSLQIDSLDYPINVENSQDEVFANFRKEQIEDTLILRIVQLRDYGNYFDILKEASTSASYGSVYISWKPD